MQRTQEDQRIGKPYQKRNKALTKGPKSGQTIKGKTKPSKKTSIRQIEVVNIKHTELEKHREEHIRRLEKVAGLSAKNAKTTTG